MDGVALDRARPDDRDLHDQVVQVGRLRLGQRLHLGPALDLEDADGVRGLEHLEDLRHVLRQPIEVDAGGAVALDQLERLVDRGEHAEAEQVELDQLERLDVALVELDDDAVRHGGPLQRRDVDQRRGGHEHAAGVDGEVAREAVDAGAERQPALPVRHAGRGAAAHVRGAWRLRLDPRHARMRLAAPQPTAAAAPAAPAVGARAGSAAAAPFSRSRSAASQATLAGESPGPPSVVRPDRPPPRQPPLLLHGRAAAQIRDRPSLAPTVAATAPLPAPAGRHRALALRQTAVSAVYALGAVVFAEVARQRPRTDRLWAVRLASSGPGALEASASVCGHRTVRA